MILIPSSLHSRYPATSGEINALLGLGAKGKLPEGGLPATTFAAVRRAPGQTDAAVALRVWVNPLVRKSIRTSVHRVRCACPDCGFETSVGRIAQHVCK